MREIVLDTETTGLDPARGDRVIEIGAVELFNHLPTGKTYHVHINPERDVPKEAFAVHGLSTEFLRDKPVFEKIADGFLEFIEDSPLVIHNAAFDVGFLNAELGFLRRAPLLAARIIDTLMIARQKHPMGPNSLDALCKRYGVDNSGRGKHGALIDSELLAAVYIELIGGRQPGLTLAENRPKSQSRATARQGQVQPRPVALASRLTAHEQAAHEAAIAKLGGKALWKN
ncbi:MAG: DNA polymerase III subunit epsilon [Aestuariivirgaceae bacterium]|nr:DNA polymerase III subunit epsilon [Aestuariivirgaceae bacterium]